MPDIRTLEDMDRVDEWRSEFVRLHSTSPNGWIHRREALTQELLFLFEDSLASLDSTSPPESARSRTRVKFALYRLGQLGFGNVADIIVDLVAEQPWLLNVRRDMEALALQGREDLLTDTFERVYHEDAEQWGYVRASILKAFSSLPSASEAGISLLVDSAIRGKTLLEKTMASEALFVLRATDTLGKESLVRLIEEAEDEYLAKNYVLLHTVSPGEGELLTADLTRGTVLNEAIEYGRVVPDVRDLYRYEPDLLRERFYAGGYPDNSEEFSDFPYM